MEERICAVEIGQADRPMAVEKTSEVGSGRSSGTGLAAEAVEVGNSPFFVLPQTGLRLEQMLETRIDAAEERSHESDVGILGTAVEAGLCGAVRRKALVLKQGALLRVALGLLAVESSPDALLAQEELEPPDCMLPLEVAQIDYLLRYLEVSSAVEVEEARTNETCFPYYSCPVDEEEPDNVDFVDAGLAMGARYAVGMDC